MLTICPCVVIMSLPQQIKKRDKSMLRRDAQTQNVNLKIENAVLGTLVLCQWVLIALMQFNILN